MASETTPLTSGDESRTYLFLSQRHHTRRARIRQFQCCVCAAMLGIFVTAMVITVSYSMNHVADDEVANNETNMQVLQPAPINSAALKTLLNLKWPRSDVASPIWAGPMPTDSEVAAALEAGEESMRNKDTLEEKAAVQNEDLASPTILKLGTPSYLHQQSIKTSPEAIKAARVGYVIGKATEKLMKGKSHKNSVGKGPRVNGYWMPTEMSCTSKDSIGTWGMKDSNSACLSSRYREMDGRCNNLKHPEWGMAMQPLRRVIPPDYGDGISHPRESKDGSRLPSARDVSLTVHRPIYRNDPKFTVMLAVWGQFFDHDITATALSKSKDGAPISCCTADGKVATENLHPECYPVVLSPEDPYYSKYGLTCMDFVRSAPAPTCNFGSREQLNQVTSYIDGSVIYGSSDDQSTHLRSSLGKGELEMMQTPDGRELLPASKDPKDGCNTPDMNQDGKYCFKSGDSRANENLHLTTMHLLLSREHNRIVRALSQMNPAWSDDKLYKEGRHIVSAQMQHITYNEFLPVVLGQSMIDRLKLAPQKEGYFNGYDPNVNPSAANNFATAAFRFAHTLLPTLMKILSNDTSNEEYVELHKILFNPYALYYPGKMDGALQGALNTTVQRVDTYITPEVTQHLFQQKWSENYDKTMEKAGTNFKGKRKGYGLDLASLNVQRGRDHGLPSYPEWREYCGLSRPKSFSDLREEMDEAALERLASLYRSVDDVDMYSGSLSEIPTGEGLLGPTFSCLIADQFLRLKAGDRFWYETPELPQAFTPDQLAAIRQATLASIICENSGVDRAQQWVMQAVADINPRISCQYIPRLQLEAWQGKNMVGNVKLSPFPSKVSVMQKKLEDTSAVPASTGSPFIKGTVTSASITAMGSDGTATTVMQSSSTFPMTIPVHLFDQKISVMNDATSNYADGIMPPFYHGGGGVTWTGSLTSSDPTKALLKGSFSVPVFKHGTTAFDFSMTTYTGDFEIYMNLAGNTIPPGNPSLQGTYNSGIYFKTELSSMINPQPSNKEMEKLMVEPGKSGPKLPMAPVMLYGTYSLDHMEFYWDGNVSFIFPPPTVPIVMASDDGMTKPKAPSTVVDVVATWGVITSTVGPPTNPDSTNSKTVVTTWWDGTLPVAIPQPAFDRTVVGGSTPSSAVNPGDGVTWSGFLTSVAGTDDVQLNGTFSFPVFLHGAKPPLFTLQIWHGDFSTILHPSPKPGSMPLVTSLRLLSSGVKYKSPIYFHNNALGTAPPNDVADASNVTIPIILHGYTSIDKSIFYWNGNASIIMPPMVPDVLLSRGRESKRHRGDETVFGRDEFEQSHKFLQATGGSVVKPLTLSIVSASVNMTSSMNTNDTGKNITWNGEFPVTLPQSLFYQKGPLSLSDSDMDIDYPYTPLAAPPASTKPAYKSGITWSNLSVEMMNSSTTDIQLNGSLSFPVYYFPTVTTGPWPGATIESWSGNFSCVVRANSTTEKPVDFNNLLTLISLGNFSSSVYFTEDSETGKLTSMLSEADDESMSTLKVIMLLSGIKSPDKKEFYWNGIMTLIIRGLPKLSAEFNPYKSTLGHKRLQATGGSVVQPLTLSIVSASVNMTSSMNTNDTGKNITWNGEFPVTLPQSLFYRKGPLSSSDSDMDVEYPYTPLAAPPASTKPAYKSGITWSNLSVEMMNSSTTDIQLNGSLSFPVYYFPTVTTGPWPGATIESWSGNFSCVLRANSTTGKPVDFNNLLTLISLGNFSSSVYFTEDSETGKSGKLTSTLSEADDESMSTLKVIMLLSGIKSPDKKEFYWNGIMTLIIRGLPTGAPGYVLQAASMGGNPSIDVMGSYISGAVSSGNVMGLSKKGRSFWWSGMLPLSINMPPFDTVSPDAGVYTWPYDPTFFNGTGGVTWSGRIIRTSSVKKAISVKGSFTAPVFIHGNPSVYSVDEWNGDFELEIDLYNDNGLIDSFPPDMYNSQLIFREHTTLGTNDISDLDKDKITSIQSFIMQQKSLSSSGDSMLHRVPIILWGKYSPDKSTFSWEGNATIIFPSMSKALLGTEKQMPSEIDTDVSPQSKNIKLPFKILTGSLINTSPIFGKKVLWDGTIPFTTLESYFNGYTENSSYIGGPMIWTGHISRSTAVANGADFKGSFTLPVFVHTGETVTEEALTGYVSLSVQFTGTQNIVDLIPTKGTYSSIITIAPGKPGVEMSLQDDSNTLLNMALNNLMSTLHKEKSKFGPGVTMVLPACFFGSYDSGHFTFNGDGITIVPSNVTDLISSKYSSSPSIGKPKHFPVAATRISSDTDPDVSPQSKNIKLPFKILTGSLITTSPIFGKKVLWDGTIPFTTLESYFNGFTENSSYIGGPMIWTGHISRSTAVANGADFKGSFTLPVFVHTGETVTEEALTGYVSLSVQFTGTQNIVDLIPTKGTYSSIITIAPGKPGVEMSLQDDSNTLLNMALNNLMSTLHKEKSKFGPGVTMVLPACFFGSYDSGHFTFNGDGITIVPSNVTDLISLKYASHPYISGSVSLPSKPSLSLATVTKSLERNSEILRSNSSIKVPFKILTGSLTATSTIRGESVVWDGKIPFTTLQSYFNGYSENSSFIGGPMKWTGHISHRTAVDNGADIEGSFSVPVFVHSNGTVIVEYMTGDLSLSVSFSGTQNIVDILPKEATFSSIITIAPAHPDVEMSLKGSQNDAKSNTLLNMAIGDLMNSIDNENSDSYSSDIISMPVCFFGSYDSEDFTFNGDAIVIIPNNLTDSSTLTYENVVQDMSSTTKLQIGATNPYISGTITAGNVMGLSKNGQSFWWSGMFPLPIKMPPFDSVSPNSAVYNWPYDPAFYNGTGGVTWSGSMTRISSVKNGISIKGSFTVPIFTHGNPSVFSVDVWNGDFEIEMSLFYNNTIIGSSFPSGTYSSPMIFREVKTLGDRDPSGCDLDAIEEVGNMMMLSRTVAKSNDVNATHPRVPVILWGYYSADRSIFYWEGNATVVFPAMPTNLFTALNQLSYKTDSQDKSNDEGIRLPMKILSGKITSTSPVFGEKILWDGKIPFTTLQSYFSKYPVNTSFIGGPVQWAGQISRNTSVGNGAQIEGSFALPLSVHSNATVSTEYMTGDFSFVVSFDGTQNIVDLIPNTGKFTTYLILGVAHDEYVMDSEDDESYLKSEKVKQLKLAMKQSVQSTRIKDSQLVSDVPTVMTLIFLGDYGPGTFTFNGEVITIIPENVSPTESPKLLKSSSKRNLPGSPYHVIPYYPKPYPNDYSSNFQVSKKMKIFGTVKSGQIYGGVLGHGSRAMWTGTFPAQIPMPAFDRRSHHNESHAGHPQHPHRMDGGVTWEVTEIVASRDGGYVEGNFFFPVYKHGKYHTYSIRMWAGQFSFHFNLPGDQSVQRLINHWQRYTSRIYFHHYHSDWDLFNPGSRSDELRDQANKQIKTDKRKNPNNGPIIILKGTRNKSAFLWSGKFILVFTP